MNSAQSGETALPAGWRMVYTEDGKPYYQNDITKETQWNPPQATSNDCQINMTNAQGVNPTMVMEEGNFCKLCCCGCTLSTGITVLAVLDLVSGLLHFAPFTWIGRGGRLFMLGSPFVFMGLPMIAYVLGVLFIGLGVIGILGVTQKKKEYIKLFRIGYMIQVAFNISVMMLITIVPGVILPEFELILHDPRMSHGMRVITTVISAVIAGWLAFSVFAKSIQRYYEFLENQQRIKPAQI